jgi:hypothetical protein
VSSVPRPDSERGAVQAQQAEPGAQKDRTAVVVLNGVSDVPAGAMLDVADRLRQAVRSIGIADVRIEVAGAGAQE